MLFCEAVKVAASDTLTKVTSKRTVITLPCYVTGRCKHIISAYRGTNNSNVKNEVYKIWL